VILQRPIERAQMAKLLATGKTDLLQFVSARTRRPFSAFLARQADGKIGFEFEPRDASKAKGARGARSAAALKVLGAHPKDGKPVELHAGRYGPYVKHGAVNATLPDREHIDALTLAEALTLLDAKAARTGTTPPAKSRARPSPTRKRTPTAKVAEPARGYVPVVKTGRSKLAAVKPTATPKAKTQRQARSQPVAKTASRAKAKPAARTSSKRK